MGQDKTAVPILRREHFTGEIDAASITITENTTKVFIPTWDNTPEELSPVVTLGGVGILTYQNISAIISSPGGGKSSIIEAIGATYLNSKSDGLGFKIDQSCDGIIIIDTERTNYDVWTSFFRMCQRAKIPIGGSVKNVKLAGLRGISNLQERLVAIEALLDANPCSLLMIDGAGDLVTDINDLKQATECRIWLRYLTEKFKLSIIVTLHPNPGSSRPRGHQGSEICREAECVLLLKAYDKDTRTISTDFVNGKNRNGPNITTAFQWSEGKNMFLTVNSNAITADKKLAKTAYVRQELMNLARTIIKESAVRYTDLYKAVMKINAEEIANAKRRVKAMLKAEIIQKDDIGHYIINPDITE